MKPFPTKIDSVDEFKKLFDEVEYILTGTAAFLRFYFEISI